MTTFALIGLLIGVGGFVACGIVALFDQAERRERAAGCTCPRCDADGSGQR